MVFINFNNLNCYVRFQDMIYIILLGLVCFKETKFQESIFLIFPCLATIQKVSQRKVNSGQ